jgi:hypothetical protein
MMTDDDYVGFAWSGRRRKVRSAALSNTSAENGMRGPRRNPLLPVCAATSRNPSATQRFPQRGNRWRNGST